MPPEITSLGQLLSVVQSSDESAQSDLQQFHDSLIEALKNGDYNVDSILSKASEELLTIAENVGIDLEEGITDIIEKYQNGTYTPPENPPANNGGKPQDPLQLLLKISRIK